MSKLRNRVIGRVLHEIGLVEQWGSGIQRVISMCPEAGLAMPVFEDIGFRYRVTLFIEQVPAPTLPLRQRRGQERRPALHPTRVVRVLVVMPTRNKDWERDKKSHCGNILLS